MSKDFATTVPLDEWLRVIRTEYLDDLIPSGGSAVKFVSGPDQVLESAREAILADAVQRRILAVSLDPGQLADNGKKPDYHRIDRFFFAVTREVDWRDYASRQLRTHLQNHGIALPQDGSLDERSILSVNPDLPESEFRKLLQNLAISLVTDHDLAYEFRAAIAALQQALVNPAPSQPTLEEAILLWLKGETKPGVSSVLKRIQIYDRITVRNARHMLISLCRWLPSANYNGLLAVLDLRPYENIKITKTVLKKMLYETATSGGDVQAVLKLQDTGTDLYYSAYAFIQMLSLLRHFIDEVDRIERFFLVVLTSRSFYDVESQRGVYVYPALKERVALEVHDSGYANPAEALVHLAGEG
jgi:hypothetical protein